MVEAGEQLSAALAHEARGDLRTAESLYRAAIKAFPDHPAFPVNLARLLRRSEASVDEALSLLYDTVARQPDYAPARLSLVETLRTAAARPQDAQAEARTYTERYPEDGNGHLCLALVLFGHGRLCEAMASAERAAALPGKPARALELKADIHIGLGDPKGAVDCYRARLGLEPNAEIHSRMLTAMQYCDAVDDDRIFEETRRWARQYEQGVRPPMSWPWLDFAPARSLRVGFVSGDFRQCSTPLLALPLFEHWPADWTVTLYSNSVTSDAWSARCRRTAARWVDIFDLDDDQAAARIQDDRIDVLVDLNGHTLGGRLGIFRCKPAPVQVAWLDYVGTTGLSTFDAIIGDPGHLPLTDQPRYYEPIRHVADNLYRFLPVEATPDVSQAPVRENGFVSFGCFNSAYKLSQTTLSRWAAILSALPTARLILNAREFAYWDTVKRYMLAFEQYGIRPSRIEFRPGAPDPWGILSAYRDVDIALDTTPYSGGLTTLEALYMGVPVVTAPGTRFGSRHSAVHLSTLGLTDWIARDDRSYVELAVQKAQAVGSLVELRANLRARLATSALVDGEGFAQELSAIVRDLWRRACDASRVPSERRFAPVVDDPCTRRT